MLLNAFDFILCFVFVYLKMNKKNGRFRLISIEIGTKTYNFLYYLLIRSIDNNNNNEKTKLKWNQVYFMAKSISVT